MIISFHLIKQEIWLEGKANIETSFLFDFLAILMAHPHSFWLRTGTVRTGTVP